MLAPAKKKVYVAVVVAGLGAIIIDRLIGYSSPTPAMAQGLPERSAAAAAQAIAGVTPTSNLETTAFPVVQTAPSNAIPRDPFIAPPAIFEKPVQAAPTGESGLAPAPGSANLFHGRHTISALVDVAGAQYAVVDGVLVGVGQMFDGCTLDEIGPRAARFRCLDGDVVLRLAGPLPSAPVR